MSKYDPADVPLCQDREAVEERYSRAEREREPFFAVEVHEDGYAVTYDLLPAGARLVDSAHDDATARITAEVEAIVGDESLPTTEVSRSVSPSLASISLFTREESARRVAAAVSEIVLDRTNWEAATRPTDRQTRQN